MVKIFNLIKSLNDKGIFLFLEQDRLKTKAARGAITPAIATLIKDNKIELLEYLHKNNLDKTHSTAHGVPIAPAARTGDLKLSFSQQRLWLLDKIDGGSIHYNMPAVLCLTGVLNREALTKAVNTIVERHEALRTNFQEGSNGQPSQIIRDISGLDVPLTDLSDLDVDERYIQAEKLASFEANKAFDLSSDTMLRAQLIRVSNREHLLLVTLHHIASDGWSMAVLIKEFSTLYAAYVRGQTNPLSALEIQYADFAQWQRGYLQGEALEKLAAYWTTQLAGLPVVHNLPLDRARPQAQSFSGSCYESSIDANINNTLKRLCQGLGCTLFMGLHAAFSVLLSRYSNETDIVVGSPIANREQAEVKSLIGFFVNTLVLRSDVSTNATFNSLLAQSKTTLLDAYAHQQMPFEQIVERLQPERNSSHSPLVQIMLVLHNNEEASLDLPGINLRLLASDHTVAKYDLTLSFIESSDGLDLTWEYNVDLFEADTIQRMAKHFELLLNGLVEKSDESVFSINILPGEEVHQQLIEWTDSQVDYPNDACIHELFEQQVIANPDAVAVVFDDTQLSYGELNQRANQLANYLVEQRNVTPDTLVGICVERSLEMIVGIFGILKAGGAYVPLDPAYPDARLAFMLDDSKVATVLTQTSLQGQLPINESQAVVLDSEPLQAELQGYSIENVAVQALTPNQLAYVIYTSGSTGTPKGVLIEHQNVRRLFDASSAGFSFDTNDVWTLFHSFAFDFSVWEIFGALLHGGKLVVVPKLVAQSANDFWQLLHKEQVTVLNQTPSAFAQLIISDNQHSEKLPLRYVVFGGEALNFNVLRAWSEKYGCEQPHLINMYGITETTVHVTYRRIDTSDIDANGDISDIGLPLQDLSTLVLSPSNDLLPIGVAGELHVGGAGLARGYLNRPELSAEKFIDNPFYDASRPSSSKRLYKTGDLVRYLADGNLEYLGRIDHQVKIRGYRIELGEIEHQLLKYDDVDNAVVVALSDEQGDKRLVAYVAHKDARLMSDDDALRQGFINGLKDTLADDLPDFMVPSAFAVLSELPLTTNGKVDRKALPAPDLSLQQKRYVAPTSEIETQLCEVWQDALGIEKIGITDNFFELGGHSLLATQLMSKVNIRLGVQAPLSLLFSAPTISEFSIQLAKQDSASLRASITPISRKQELLLSFSQQRLWLLDKIDGGSLHYNMPAALRLSGQLNCDAATRALNTIVERHESLRTCFNERVDGQPLQVIQSFSGIDIPFIDLSSRSSNERDSELTRLAFAETKIAFDLRSDILLRASLIKLSDVDHVLLVTMHHIASDGWSMGVLIKEFSKLYGAYVHGEANPLPVLELQYVDYAQWQRNHLQGEVLEQYSQYWSSQLDDLPRVHNLPLDRKRPLIQTFRGSVHESFLGNTLNNKLKGLCQQIDGTLFMGLHAAFSVLLSRYSNETDIVMGSPIANREQAEVASLIGFFVNTLVLRSDVYADATFNSLLAQSKATLVGAYAHQQMPFEQLVERLKPERSSSYSPLFQVMLVLQNNDEVSLDLPGIKLRPLAPAYTVAKYDLTLSVTECSDGLRLAWEYNVDLFEADTIQRMAKHFELLLNGLVEQPDESVFSINMLPGEEVHQQLIEWTDSQVDYPNDACIHELFEQQVIANPDAVAVVFDDTQLSYGELNQRANQLANYLVEQRNVTPDTLVGICVERSLEMIVGIFGILKAGGAYVPLDPAYPDARLAFMLDDSKVATFLTQTSLQGQLPINESQAVVLDSEPLQAELQGYSNENVAVQALTPNQLAYVIYTSGSTGTPKGVLIEHQNVRRLFDASSVGFSFDNNDVWTLFHSFAFDFSVWEIFGALLHGGKLIVVPKLVAQSANGFWQLLHKEQVTVLNQTPSAFAQLINSDNQHSEKLPLRYVVFGGEALNFNVLRAWSEKYGCEQPHLINMYGITETTVHVTYRRIDTSDIDANGDISDIGLPLQDLSTLVLSPSNDLLPIGVAGELHVGGAGLARGYLNRPELSAEKFIDNPFYDASRPNSSKRLYKTGDLVRYLADGNLEYLGRIDHQVKIRGYRIELGEIEHQLLKHDDVDNAVVVALSDEQGDKRLVAYVAHKDARLMSDDDALRQGFINGLKDTLADDLPDFMVPSAFAVLSELPLTTNGKVDRKALPAPDLSLQQKRYVAPTSEIETQLCEVWQEALGIEKIGITDNFFELGGHSLLATRVIATINTRLSIEAPIKLLFDAPTVVGLSLRLAALAPVTQRSIIRPVSRQQDLLLSFSQQRLWLLDKIDGGSAHYNMPTALRLTGALNYSAITKALNTIVERHESLRTSFVESSSGQPLQIIRSFSGIDVAHTDISSLADINATLAKLMSTEASTAFDLSSDTMLRAQLIKVSNTDHVLLITLHHIASDGWSMGLLINEFNVLYSAYLRGKSNPLPALEVQYADYAQWQRNHLQGTELEELAVYWEAQLNDLPVIHSLPLDHARPQVQSFAGSVYESLIDTKISDKLKRLCQQIDGTLFMGLHAVFSVLLARYSNETDIVIGSPIANREQAGVTNLIGFFVNTLVLRSDLSQNPSFSALLERSKANLLDAYARQQMPFEQLVERLQPERSLSHSPLFQVMLVVQNNEEVHLDLPDITFASLTASDVVAKYDLTLNVIEHSDGLKLGWEYNTDLFNANTIECMANHFELLLSGLVEQPNEGVLSIDMLTDSEIDQQLIEWNDTQTNSPQDRCIHELFEAQVTVNPDAVAVVFEGHQLSYRELNRKANQLAHYLIEERQVCPETLVGICVERSLDMIIGILGILKAGGAYVPLDPNYPAARLAYMLDDSKLTTVLTQTSLAEKLPFNGDQSLALDSAEVRARLQTFSHENVDAGILGSNHLAYVIYTSGSTGQPKGVMVEHLAAHNYLSFAASHYCSNIKGSVVSTSLNFDATLTSIFAPLVCGKYIQLVQSGPSELEHLIALIQQADDPLLFKLTPAHLDSMKGAMCHAQNHELAHVFVVGGEEFKQNTLKTWKQSLFKNAVFVNEFGPTEATVGCSTYTVSSSDDEVFLEKSVSIGKAISNVHLYVLDSHLKPVPLGVTGELYIGGAGLARGYLARPALTAEKFIDNPFYDANRANASRRLYKTGDLVRYLNDGNLEFLGRIDHQVKVRGFRIELGEIENQLLNHDQVNDAVVTAIGNEEGDKRLVAYVTHNQAAEMHTEDQGARSLRQDFIVSLKSVVSQGLPEHMMPSAFVVLDELPLTPNGKVDRKALPVPDMALQQKSYVAPTTETETQLCLIWQEVLGLEQVGVTDNFFELGGHSLLVIKMMPLIKDALNKTNKLRQLHKNFSVPIIFQYPTISDSLAYLHSYQENDLSNPVKLNTATKGPKLFLFHEVSGLISPSFNLADAIGSRLPVYGFEAVGNIKLSEESTKITSLASRYIEDIKTVQAEGPYHLCGWSLGGSIAYEAALQLASRGDEVSFLGLIDTYRNSELTVWKPEQFLEEVLNRQKQVLDSRAVESILQGIDMTEAIPLVNDANKEAILNCHEETHGSTHERETIRFVIELMNVYHALTVSGNRHVESQRLDAVVNLYVAEKENIDMSEAWSSFLEKTPIIGKIDSTHKTIIEHPNIDYIADDIVERMIAEQASH